MLAGAVLVGEDGPVGALVLLLGLLDAHDDLVPVRPELAARLCRQVFRHLHREHLGSLRICGEGMKGLVYVYIS